MPALSTITSNRVATNDEVDTPAEQATAAPTGGSSRRRRGTITERLFATTGDGYYPVSGGEEGAGSPSLGRARSASLASSGRLAVEVSMPGEKAARRRRGSLTSSQHRQEEDEDHHHEQEVELVSVLLLLPLRVAR